MRDVAVSSMTRFFLHALNAYQNEYTAAAARANTRSHNLNRLPDMSGSTLRDALGAAEQRAHIHVALFLGREFQQVRRWETESLRDQDIGEDLHPNVIQIDLVIVELAPVGDGLFQSSDPALQLLESFVGLQLRIAFGYREQPADADAQLLLGRAYGGDISRHAGLADRSSSTHHFLERFLLELHVALASLHQLRQLVVTLFQQHVDIRPCDLDVF